MGLEAALQEAFVYSPVAPRTDDGTRLSSRPSPEEGHRLIRDFLCIERADLRQEVFRFVAETLRVQEARESPPPVSNRAAASA